MKQITLTLAGPFEVNELKAIVALVRFIDTQHPERHYEVFIEDPDATLGEAEKTLREVVPEVPDRNTEFSVHRKQ